VEAHEAKLERAERVDTDMTCHHHSHEPDYRAATVTGDLAAFLHRHNRPLIIAGAAIAAMLLLILI